MRQAVELGRKTRAGLEIGICGEHGGDPRSVEFCHRIGLNYVSCSPFRVPVARFAAAQAAVREAGWKPMPAAPRDVKQPAAEPAKAARTTKARKERAAVTS
jgi:pyruvate,orthophosphate dikinase